MASDSRRHSGLTFEVPFVEPTIRLNLAQYRAMVAHCFDGLPHEACGVLIGPIKDDFESTGDITEVQTCRNADESARTYTVDNDDMKRAMDRALELGVEVVGGWHSHTHTDAYPSATDVEKAMALGPYWLHMIVSLKQAEPVLRGYRIRGGRTEEVDVDVAGL